MVPELAVGMAGHDFAAIAAKKLDRIVGFVAINGRSRHV